ncbi:phosphoglycolate phosphatase, bacterial [Gilliamella sp. Nev5-1]|uniref:phosphoglycolate phosphatase n=1 Tax=unclassified Gilliamella TaxID=2685620 RepID=UPI00080DE957|nr:phosphoglycolate phosphatase [Gilliamella apicola]OCG58496.1 phosphoglycolate phosphatase, bacterial [Gilliamella apicola]OCG60109.1 phosphoglycolate phosphatase, bacterial [Gilliamella apicola]OCG60644.1 phosphoglycolate phosphatase, bacterial [Gilliamella apicola]OCG61135.1 phosphoglycolate phosphatase, bacterial [Gilliamella apicola]OCG69012.1 phosphoglycolate phosphatase, bacterial [Gilliamella apicola]
MNKLKDIQAIAFDLDGTLVDSVPGLALATQNMLAELNLPTISNEQIKNFVGNGIDIMLERVFKAITIEPSKEQFAKAKILFNQHYDKVIDVETRLFPNVKETLKVLYDNHYPLALVTNKPAQFLPALLASLGIKEFFSLVLGGGDVIKLKPHPAPLYQVMAKFGLFSDQLLFVGDSKNDITAAQNANCPTVALSYGYNYGVSIATSNPDFLFDDFKDILTILPQPKADAKK